MRTNIDKIYGLSPLQEGLLFHKMADERATNYVIQTVININGFLNMQHVQSSLDILSRKYEILRTAFVTPDNTETPLQVVMTERKIEFNEKTVKSLKEKEALKQLDITRGFNLSKDSLLRLTVLHMGEKRHTLLWTQHHIIVDGWCTSLLFKDFMKYYELINNGADKAQIDKLLEAEMYTVLPYSEYIKWIEKQNKEEALDHWDNILSNYESVTTVPALGITDNQNAESRSEVLVVSEKITKAIEKLASRLNVTVSTIVEIAWGLLLQKYNGCGDVVYGKVVSGRNINLPGIEQAVGLFINTIPSRVTIKEGETISNLIKRMQVQAIENAKYEYSSLAEVQSRSKIGKNLIQTLFVFENYYVDESIYCGIPELDMELESARGEVNYDLSLIVSNQGTLQLEVMYNSGLYTLGEMRCLLNRMMTLLNEIVEKPDAVPADISMMSEAERKEILISFNNTYVAQSQYKTVITRFEEQVEKSPEKIAVEYETGTLTYKELNCKANALVGRLRQLGIGPNDRVAIMSSLEAETIIAIISVLKSGSAYIPIDPEYPEERISYILSDAAPKAILTKEINIETRIPVVHMDIRNMNEEEKNPESIALKNDTAYIIYTSGTTGKPKGVEVTRGNLDNIISYATRMYQNDACVTVLITSLSFDLSVIPLYLPLISGGCILLKGGDLENKLKKTLNDDRLTLLNLTPSHLKILDIKTRWPKLRSLIIGGEELKTDIAQKMQKLLGRDVQIHNEYGPTETTVACCDYVYNENKDIGLNVPIGHPISNVQIYILQNMELCGIGIPGELCIAGDGVSKGYINHPELTAKKFIKNPYGKGKLYRSGDLARWLPDGNIEYLGRIDEQVKIRGFRIELGEIEGVLRKQPGVGDVAVVVKKIGESESLCAYIVSKLENIELNMADIKNKLCKELPDYMVPAFMMQIETLPLNRNGKLDRKALPDPDVLSGHKYVKPQNKMEQAVIEVYEEILGVSPIGIEDNFFDLGGDSIKAIKVISKLRERGFDFSVADLMRQQTARVICENFDGLIKSSQDLEAAAYTYNQELVVAIQKCLDNYGDNFIDSQGFSECRILPGQEAFLRSGTEAITDIIIIESNVKHVELAIKSIISKQGVLRTKLSKSKSHFEEYTYYDQWKIPVIKGAFDISLKDFHRIANEMDFISSGKLLSRFLIIEIDDRNCMILSAIHHLIWDGISQDLFKSMLNDALMNRFHLQKEYSYIKYCMMVAWETERIEVSSEQRDEIYRYLEIAKNVSELPSRKNAKSFTKLDVRLNDLQSRKFNEYPIKTALILLFSLLYDDLPDEFLKIPIAILEHNRNELNEEMLGFALNLNYSLYNVQSKSLKHNCLTISTSSADRRVIAEKIMLISQDYGINDLINLIPIINYQGIIYINIDEDLILKNLNLEKMSVFNNLGVGMHFYIQNNILHARISGIEIEEDLVREVIKNM